MKNLKPRTAKSYSDAENVLEQFRDVGQNTQQLFNDVDFELSCKQMRGLPKKLSRRLQKAMSAITDAGVKLERVVEDAEGWLSDNMEKFE